MSVGEGSPSFPLLLSYAALLSSSGLSTGRLRDANERMLLRFLALSVSRKAREGLRLPADCFLPPQVKITVPHGASYHRKESFVPSEEKGKPQSAAPSLRCSGGVRQSLFSL